MRPKKCIITCAQRYASLHVPNNSYGQRNASLHCARRNASLHCARRNPLLHCSILHVSEEMHHCMCSKKCIIGCARYCMCPKKRIITLCPRLHCARSLHKPKIASCSNFTCARIKSSHKYQQMSKTDTLSLLITYIPKASSSKGVIFHGLRTSCHGLRTYFMLTMSLRYHSLKASSS